MNGYLKYNDNGLQDKNQVSACLENMQTRTLKIIFRSYLHCYSGGVSESSSLNYKVERRLDEYGHVVYRQVLDGR